MTSNVLCPELCFLFIEQSNEELTESRNVIESFSDQENPDEYRPTKKLKVWLFLISLARLSSQRESCESWNVQSHLDVTINILTNSHIYGPQFNSTTLTWHQQQSCEFIAMHWSGSVGLTVFHALLKLNKEHSNNIAG